MKKKIFAFFSLFLITACSVNNNEVIFEIKNNSNNDIKNVEILASEETCSTKNYKEIISQNSKEKLILDFSYIKNSECSHPTSDGAYIFTYKIDDETFEKRFGYYTNGTPLDKKVEIEIKEDNQIFINGEEQIRKSKKHDSNDNILNFLEKKLAWINEDDGVAFCAYEKLGEQNSEIYLSAFCQEYYVRDEEIICPDNKSKELCFITKDPNKKECKEKCKYNKIKPYLAIGGGVSVPIKLTKENDSFTFWKPRDGSYYTKDLKETFPKEFYEKIDDVDGFLLNSENIRKAEKHFGVKASFENKESVNKSCKTDNDCGILPADYAIRSNCPYTTRCEENQCFVGCYNFRDYTDFPKLKEYSWEDIEKIINSGEVTEVFQSHALDVEINLKDGTKISTKEPKIDAIFGLIDTCGEKCKDIIKATE